MTDRFYGFRYEIQFKATSSLSSSTLPSLLKKIVDEADDLACFGWVQESSSSSSRLTLVGEARCTKARGPIFKEKLERIHSEIEKMETLVYEDTKIRLHFATFKILPKERETCFLDAPHQCKEFLNKGQQQPQQQNSKRQEESNGGGERSSRQDF